MEKGLLEKIWSTFLTRSTGLITVHLLILREYRAAVLVWVLLLPIRLCGHIMAPSPSRVNLVRGPNLLSPFPVSSLLFPPGSRSRTAFFPTCIDQHESR